MNRIGYIIVVHRRGEPSEPIDKPSRIYLDEQEALDAAAAVTRETSGYGQAVQVSVPLGLE